MSDELKACPFCGDEPHVWPKVQDYGPKVTCQNYKCRLDGSFNVDVWNTRHLTRAEVDRWCAENGFEVVPVGVVGFIRDCVDVQREACGLDGYDLQEQLANAGILEATTMKTACSEQNCVCAEYDSFPLECYRTTENAEAMLAAAKEDAS